MVRERGSPSAPPPVGEGIRGGVGEWRSERSDSLGGKDSSDKWEGAKRSLGQPLPRVLKQTKENVKKEQRNQLVSTHRSNSLFRIHSSVRVTASVPGAAVNPQPIPHPSSAAPPTLPSKPPTLGPPPLQTGTRSRTAVTEIRARSGFVGALPGAVGEGRAPRDPRRRGAGVSPPGSPGAPRLPPTPPTPPPRCSYVLVVTVAPRLVLEPGPAARATAAAALPGRRRGRLGSEGLGPRAVLLRPLAAQEAARLRGRREGPRGVDLASEPLVQRSHRSPRALAGCLWGVSVSAFSLWGSRSPRPPGGKGEEEEEAAAAEERTAAARRSSRAPLSSRRRATAWLSLLRPLPGGWAEPGSGGVFWFPLLFCFQLFGTAAYGLIKAIEGKKNNRKP